MLGMFKDQQGGQGGQRGTKKGDSGKNDVKEVMRARPYTAELSNVVATSQLWLLSPENMTLKQDVQ